jgi:hypothetical protein
VLGFPPLRSGASELNSLASFMAEVTVKIFHELEGQRELVKTIHVHTKSTKPLNGKSARQILFNQFPSLGKHTILLKTDQGWMHKHAVKVKQNCAYHYTWEIYQLYESSSGEVSRVLNFR